MGMEWYAVHVSANREKSVKKLLEERIANSGMADRFGEVFLPIEEVMEVKGGQKSITERKLYPSYLFIKMDMVPETWHLIKSTPRVSGFIGGQASEPAPIKDQDVARMLSRIKESSDSPKAKIIFEQGQRIRIKDGAFDDFEGNVEDVNYNRNKLTVSVNIFGKSTPVEVDFEQVEKI